MINLPTWRKTSTITFTDIASHEGGVCGRVLMKDEGISEALTGDNHFEQAGFKALLK